MKKGVMLGIFLFVGVLVFASVASAQTYSGFEKFTDGVKLFFSSGDNKVKLALEIREKEINSALENVNAGNEGAAIKNLDSASEKLELVQERVSLETAEEVRASVGEITMRIDENGDLPIEFDEYKLQEEMTGLSVERMEKVFDYCDKLAMQDYEAMQEDEKCRIYSWMEKKLSERIGEIKEEDAGKIKQVVGECMNNPKECECGKISLLSEKKKCEEYKALAIRCEFQNDAGACSELEDVESTEVERDDYEREILEKYLPGECLEAGVKSGDECKKLIIAVNRPETECIENGVVLSEVECDEKLVREDKIPKDCVENGQAVSSEECLTILKEKSKPTEDEFELMSGECKELGIYDPDACDEIVNLPRPCKDAGFYTKRECEEFTLTQNLPADCVEAGALTPEACEKLKLPSDCQGEAFSREECETVLMKQKFPDECKSAGEFDPEKCAVIMVGEQSLIVTPGAEMEYLVRQGLTFDEIPSVCMDGKNFIRSMDCDVELAKFGITLPTPTDTGGIPKECMIDERTAVSPQECQNKLEQNIIVDAIPKECSDAGVTNPEECGKFVEGQRLEQGIGLNMPEECAGISVEQCKGIMQEKGIEIKQVERVQQVEKVEKMCKEGEVCEEQEYESVTLPEECVKIGISDYADCKISMSKINEERIKQGDEIVVDEEGNVEYITNEEIGKIVDNAEKSSLEVKPNVAETEGIKNEIKVIEQNMERVESGKSGMEVEDDANSGGGSGGNIMSSDGSDDDSSGGSEVESDDDESDGDDSGSEGNGGDASEGNGGGDGGSITGEAVRLGDFESSVLGKFLRKLL